MRKVVFLFIVGSLIAQAQVSVVTTSPLPDGNLGSPYSFQMVAIGGTAPHTWRQLGGALPNGIILTLQGQLTGTPTTATIWNFGVEATDLDGVKGSANFSLTVNPGITITNPSQLPPTVVGPYSQTFNATGGIPPYAWSGVPVGALPPGLGVTPAGVLSGTTGAPGSYSFSIQVVDSAQASTTKTFDLLVNVSPLVIITPPLLPPSTVGAVYSRTLQATGGIQPYTWTIIAGTPPPGIVLDSVSGALSGIPTTPGLFGFQVRVSDGYKSYTGAMQALINPPFQIVTTSPIMPGVAGVPYAFTLVANGGTQPYSGGIVLGALPPGLTLGSAGFISGTPTASGSFSFTIQISDAVGITLSRIFAITINTAISITTVSPLPSGTTGVAYSQNLSASGGAPPVKWSVAAGALPAGLTLSEAGALSGTPAVAGTTNFTAQASDSLTAVAIKQLSVSIVAGVSITTTSLPSGAVGLNYAPQLIATGGKRPFTWTMVSGALPSGVTLTPSGTLLGIPSIDGTFSFSVQVTDSAQTTATAALSVTIAPKLIVSTTSLPGGMSGKYYNQTISASGGTPPYNWSLSYGALPAGLNISSSAGTIAGTPTVAGTFSITAQVKDSAGVIAASALTLVIAAPPAISTASPLLPAVTGTAYSQSLSASGGTAPYRWSLQSGSLPQGLTLNATSGAVGGTPSAPGRSSFNAQLQDSGGSSAVKAFELTVTQTLQVSPSSLTFSGTAASQSIQVICSTVGAAVEIVADVEWLQVSASRALSPASVAVSASARGLAAGNHQGSIGIASCGASRTVGVTLTVAQVPTAAAPPPEVSPAALDFTFSLGAEGTSRRVTGAGSSAVVSPGSGWLTVIPPEGGELVVAANPSGMPGGTYTGRVVLCNGESTCTTLPVTMTISGAPQALVLTQTGLTFTSLAGFSGTLSRVFGVLNTGQGDMSWTARGSTLSGGASWLAATPASGVSNSSGSAATITVSVNPSGLGAGEYYGQIAITAPSAGNVGEVVSVVLNVLPADKAPGPQVYPTGLVFIGTAGGPNPNAQSVTLTNVAGLASSYTSSKSAGAGASWITLSSATGSAPPSATTRITAQANTTGLSAGVRQGTFTLQFGDGSLRTVDVALVLRAGPAANSAKIHSTTTVGCAPARLIPIFTSLGSDFNIPASWPSALEMIVVDDCGEPLTAGSVATTFSNGDPVLALTALREGNWGGTWTPRSAGSAGVTLTAQSRNTTGNLQGSVRMAGALRTNPNVPVISSNGVVSSASYAAQAPLAPGSLIAIFGSYLADGQASAQSLPLPTVLGQTQVLMDAQELPLVFVSEGQINAMLPYDIAVNTRHQLIVRRGSSYTTPEPVTLAPAEPAVFTRDQSGKGPGIVIDSRYQFVDASNPAAAGDVVVIYTTGLGEVTPKVAAGMPAPVDSLRPTASPVTVTMGGVSAPQVLFAGLAPGFTGLYQINVVIPVGVAAGAVPVVISVGDRPGPPVTIAIR